VAAHLKSSSVMVPLGPDALPTSVATALIDDDGAATYTFDLAWELPGLADRLPFMLQGTTLVHTGSIATMLAPDAAVASYPRVGWDGLLAGRTDGDTVLDVRRTDEFAASHVAGAVNVPVHQLLTRLGEVPAGRLWVHCGTGYRAGVAASLLQRAGRDVVHLDARFSDAEAAGVPLDNAPA
jgi:rhodanese-related sulfurtransferase